VRTNFKSGRVSGKKYGLFPGVDFIAPFIYANAIAECTLPMFSVVIFSRVSSVSSSSNTAVKRLLHRLSCELLPTAEERKQTYSSI
jgi:hypothetical protein